MMKIDLYTLLYHLKNCPGIFMEPAGRFEGGRMHTEAVIADCYRAVAGDFLLADRKFPRQFHSYRSNPRHIPAIHISCWFFNHPLFQGQPALLPGIAGFMFDALPALAPYVTNTLWIEDEDRNEEFVRLALKYCSLLPEGETEVEAMDRLDALDTIKRLRVLKDSASAFERMAEIRRKMAEDKAREAANVYGRE